MGKKFIRNHYHNALFKWHVLGQRNFTDPGSPPYYSADFFTIIREVLENDQPRITRMTSVEWYKILLKRNMMMETKETGETEMKLMKLEKAKPE